ncbi:beta-galactoside alpha-2,6-sialyltransferase 2-like [Genypterus blacodes]|uniref:beta-galactoside alpha-2,6-sialyltransferase 2-like n=1 Tax=Genypterus blacodes TaxID=154954 RepID=UPI003F7652B1
MTSPLRPNRFQLKPEGDESARRLRSQVFKVGPRGGARRAEIEVAGGMEVASNLDLGPPGAPSWISTITLRLHSSRILSLSKILLKNGVKNFHTSTDSHDAVIRFNAAPTRGFERDVGNKTTIRLFNSQILTLPNFQFNSSPLYQDVTLVAWDPASYSLDLLKWFKNPDYDLFTPYSERRRRRPKQPFYILHPRFLWSLWDVIQANTVENIQPHPPSSGFLGIMLMLTLCGEVDVYEFLPSVRQTDLCHYHERKCDKAYTIGDYHPLLYEKRLVQRMNVAAEPDVRTKGKVTLPGFSSIHCET